MGPEGSSGPPASKSNINNIGLRTNRDGGGIVFNGIMETLKLVADSVASDFRIIFASYGKDGPGGIRLRAINGVG